MAKPTQADLNAAARGLRMVSMDVYELQELVKEFKTKGTFATDVIVQAAQQILAVKKRNYARNPQPRKKPAKRAKSYITRPSQATRAAPSKRLKARRAKVASGAAPKGYFPNPRRKRAAEWCVYGTRNGAPAGSCIARFGSSKTRAAEYARALAHKSGRTLAVVKR